MLKRVNSYWITDQHYKCFLDKQLELITSFKEILLDIWSVFLTINIVLAWNVIFGPIQEETPKLSGDEVVYWPKNQVPLYFLVLI